MANVNNTMLSLARGTTSALAGKTKTDGLLTFDKTKKRVSLDVANGNTIDRIPIDGISMTSTEYNNLSSTEKANGTYYLTDTGKIIRDGVEYGGSGGAIVLKNQYLTFSQSSLIETVTKSGDAEITVNKDNIKGVWVSTGSVEFYWLQFYYTVNGGTTESRVYRDGYDVVFQLPDDSDYHLSFITISVPDNTEITLTYQYLEDEPSSHAEISNANITAGSYCSVFFNNASLKAAIAANINAHVETGKIVFDTAIPISSTLTCDIIIENSGAVTSGTNFKALTNAENNHFIYSSTEPTENLIANKTVWVG